MTSVGGLSFDVSGTALTTPVDAASTKHRTTFLVAAVSLLVLLIGFWPAFEGDAEPMDEGMLLVYPELIQHGRLPYRDFETLYGPANPALLAAVFYVAGANIFVERTVGLLYRALILLAVFAIVQNWGKTLAAGCMVLTGGPLLATNLAAYAWLGAMVCVLWSLLLGNRPDSGVRCFFAGLLAGCAILFRVDVGPAVIISALPLLLGMKWPERWKYVFGAAVALLPLGILALFTGLQPLLANLFLIPVIYANPGRHLPLFSAKPYLVNLFFAQLLAAVVNVLAGIITLRSPSRDQHGRLLLSAALLGLGVTYQAAQRLDSLHLFFAAFISLGILPLSVVIIWSRLRNRKLETSETLLAVVASCAALQLIAPQLSEIVRTAFTAGFHAQTGGTFVEHNGRSYAFRSFEMAVSVKKMLAKLDRLSTPGERLFVGPADLRRTNCTDTYIYHMMPKLTPATYFLEMNPFSANASGSRLAADVQSADWLVLNRTWDYWKEPNRSSDYGSDAPNSVVKKRFELCGEFGGYLLFRRKSLDALTRGSKS